MLPATEPVVSKEWTEYGDEGCISVTHKPRAVPDSQVSDYRGALPVDLILGQRRLDPQIL